MMKRPEPFTFVRLDGEPNIDGYTIVETDACMDHLKAEIKYLHGLKDRTEIEGLYTQEIYNLKAEIKRERDELQRKLGGFLNTSIGALQIERDEYKASLTKVHRLWSLDTQRITELQERAEESEECYHHANDVVAKLTQRNDELEAENRTLKRHLSGDLEDSDQQDNILDGGAG